MDVKFRLLRCCGTDLGGGNTCREGLRCNNCFDKLEGWREIELLRDEVHFDDQTIKSLFEIKDRLQESLKKIAELDIDRSVAQRYRPDGIPSKMDRCNHGIAMYDECAECVADFARAALKGGE